MNVAVVDGDELLRYIEIATFAFGVLSGVFMAGLYLFRTGTWFQRLIGRIDRMHEDHKREWKRNSAHHALMFSRLDVKYEEVVNAERNAGLGPNGSGALDKEGKPRE